MKKNFLVVQLRGRQVVWPVLIMMLISVVVAAIAGYDTAATSAEMTVVDGAYLVGVIVGVVLFWAIGVGVTILSFDVVRATVESVVADGERFSASYDRKELFSLAAKGSLLTIVTLGIYGPWFLAKLMNFAAQGVMHKHHSCSFRGRGVKLFCYSVLSLVLPVAVAIAVIIASGLLVPESAVESFAPVAAFIIVVGELLCLSLWSGLYCRWYLDFTYGGKELKCKASAAEMMWFFVKQNILSFITFGLYLPMVELRVWRFMLRNTTLADQQQTQRLGMELHPWRDWAWLWGQVLLVVITLGIYTPWAYAKTVSRFGSRIFIEE